MPSPSLNTVLPRPSRIRAGLLCLSTAFLLTGGAALAQDKGPAAFDAYADGLRKLGLTVENGPVSYDGASDTLTVPDSILSLTGTIRNLPAGETQLSGETGKRETDPSKLTDLTYEIRFSSGAIAITGLSHEGGAFHADRWVYSDDSELVIDAEADGKGRLKIDGRLIGASATDYAFTMPEIPAADPARQVSRWLPYARTALLTSYEEARVENTALTLEAVASEDGKDTLVTSGTMQMNGFRLADAKDGRIGEYSIDSMIQSLRTLDPGSGNMLAQETRQGKTIYTDMDLAVLIDLFDPDVPAGDTAAVITGSASLVDYATRQEIGHGAVVDIAVDRASMSELTAVKRDNRILALFDDLLAQKVPAAEDLITGVFQFYRSFGLMDARMSGITVTAPGATAGEETEVSIAEMAMSEISSNGIGEMLVVGIDAPNLPHGGTFKLDWAAIKDIEFAEYTPMRAMISTLMADPDFGEEHPLDVMRAFLPRSFGYEIEGLDVTVPEVGRTRIDAAEMTVSTTVPPLPTSVHVRNSGIRVPVGAIEDGQAQALFRALGLDTVVWSDETRLTWDEATLELRLERLMLDIEGLGRAELSARFANVPKALFEDPENQGQMAMIVAQFVDASLSFRDGGLATKGVAHVAEAEGIPENVFREALVAQATEATRPIGNAAFTGMVGDAVSSFLENPGELKVTMTPPGPVPLAQILGSLAAPQTLPDLLNVSVTAE